MDYKKFKKILKKVTISSFCLTIFFGSDIDVLNLDKIEFSYVHFKNIIFTISSSVLASVILLWGVDSISRREEEKEDKQRRTIIFNKIIPYLVEYYDLYLKLYISTRKELVEEDNPVLHSLIDCKEEFLNQLNETEPFLKKGDRITRDSARKHLEKVNANKEEKFEVVHYKWYQCMDEEAKKCYNGISVIEDPFGVILPLEFYKYFEKLVKNIKVQSSAIYIVEMKQLKDLIPNDVIEKLEHKEILKALKIMETIELLEQCISFIEKDLNRNLRDRDTNFFNERELKPKLGQSCE